MDGQLHLGYGSKKKKKKHPNDKHIFKVILHENAFLFSKSKQNE